MNFVALILALAAPALLGWLLLYCFYNQPLHKSVTLVLSFVLGKSFLTLTFFLLTLTGIKLTLVSSLLAWVGLTAVTAGIAAYRHSRQFQPSLTIQPSSLTPTTAQTVASNLIPAGDTELVSHNVRWRRCHSLLTAAGIAGIVITLGSYFMMSLSEPVMCVPGETIWGFKAMVIAREGRMPSAILTDPEMRYIQPSYPLDYPLFMAWVYLCMGQVDDYLIKALPPVFATLASVLLYGLLRMEYLGRPWCVLLTLLFVTGQQFLSCSVQLYAEIPLLLTVVPGYYFLVRTIDQQDSNQGFALGVVLLCSSAWVKSEGLLFLAVGAVALVVTGLGEWWRSRKSAHLIAPPYSPQIIWCIGHCLPIILLRVLVPIVLFILPWQLYKLHLNLRVSDFRFSMLNSDDFAERAKQIGGEFLQAYLLTPSTISGFGILFLLMMLWHWRKTWNSAGSRFLLMAIFLMVAGYASIFFFSTRNIGWHILAAYRIALPVAGLMLLFVARSVKT